MGLRVSTTVTVRGFHKSVVLGLIEHELEKAGYIVEVRDNLRHCLQVNKEYRGKKKEE